LELQVASVPHIGVGRVGATSGARDGLALTEEPKQLVWQPCTISALTSLQGQPCAVIQDPPCLVQHFRLVNTIGVHAGPASAAMVAFYERPPSAPAVQLQLLGKRAPRAICVRIACALATSESTLRWATRLQVRFRVVGASGVGDTWEELEPSALEVDGIHGPVSCLVREEDGLELSHHYEFQTRFGDAYRLGAWSSASQALHFALAPPVPQHDAGIKVDSASTQATLSWLPFKPQATVASSFPSLAELPVEYSVVVHSGAQREPVASLVTRETSVTIRPLFASAAYSAHLVARWTRFSCPERSDEGCNFLLATFTTACAAREQPAAELSPHLSHERAALSGLEVVVPNVLTNAAGRVPATFQKSAARPVLPQLVPLPPPKFTARDPLASALTPPQEPSSARTLGTPRRPRPPGMSLQR